MSHNEAILLRRREKDLEDVFVGEHVMEESECEKYLGDYISNKVNNQTNIEARK